jgi:hypothetical protein
MPYQISIIKMLVSLDTPEGVNKETPFFLVKEAVDCLIRQIFSSALVCSPSSPAISSPAN